MVPFRELADSWSAAYSSSAALRSTVAFAHLGGLLSAGGLAIASDLGTLGALRRGPDALRTEVARLHAAHRIVPAGLSLVVLSGLLLLLADLDAYLASSVFWIKMALVAALLVNGAALVRAGARTLRGEDRAVVLRLVTIASIVLWFVTTLLGTVLPNAL